MSSWAVGKHHVMDTKFRGFIAPNDLDSCDLSNCALPGLHLGDRHEHRRWHIAITCPNRSFLRT